MSFSGDLSADMVSTSADPWMPFAEFALTPDGYRYRDDLAAWANRQVSVFHRTGALSDGLSLDDLRALGFYEQRRFRHLGIEPPQGEDLLYVDTLLTEIRACLEDRGDP